MGKNWAIAIGINHYDNLKPLRFAERDAEAVCQFFRQIRFDQIYYFAENASPIPQDYGAPMRAQPTYGVLSRFLRVRFDQPNFLNPEDNFWFFFAGHGKRTQGRDYLLPSDADPGNLDATALSIRSIGDRLRRSGAGNIILLLDACRDEDKDDRSGQGIGVERQQGVVTIFSCSPNELSYEIEALQQGAFTYGLLEGLQVQGEGNCATVDRLDQYLRYQVPALNQRYGKPPQSPYTVAEPVNKRHLVLLPQYAEPADWQVLKIDAFEAEAKQNWQEARQLWRRVLVGNPTDSQAFEAIERIAVRSANIPPVAQPSTPSTPDSRGSDRQATSLPINPVPPVPSNANPQRSATPTRPAPTKPIFEFEYVTVNQQGEIEKRHQGQAEYRREDLGNGVTLDLVLIPGGQFQMGSPETEANRRSSEGPQHLVTVRSFLMGKYAVTQAQWRSVAALPKVERDLQPDPSYFKGDDRPVEQVSWYEAIEFCKRLSKKTGREYRLPSEAEWEYACRAGTKMPFHFGEMVTTDLANYNGNYTYGSAPEGTYRKQTTDVGSFPPNAFGLYDMHGNVWEWCLDHWHENYGGFFRKAPTDGSAWTTGGESQYRLLRGGSWYYDPDFCRSAHRNWNVPGFRYFNLGFRVVCSSAWTL